MDRPKSWEAVLPRMFRAAGIEPGAGMVVRPLTGGVSSDIVHIQSRPTAATTRAKRALAKLKVAMDWEAPVERNHYEVAWLKRAARIVPGGAPNVVAEDRDARHRHPRLPAARRLRAVESRDARRPRRSRGARRASRASSAASTPRPSTIPTVAAEFPTDHLIEALRLDPYLRTTAKRHPDLAERILAVVATTAAHQARAGPRRRQPQEHPRLEDRRPPGPARRRDRLVRRPRLRRRVSPQPPAAEVAPHARRSAPSCAARPTSSSPSGSATSPKTLRQGLEQRTAALLPCLFLARVDGKSPVEYLGEDNRQRVREIAAPLIATPVPTVAAVIEAVR